MLILEQKAKRPPLLQRLRCPEFRRSKKSTFPASHPFMLCKQKKEGGAKLFRKAPFSSAEGCERGSLSPCFSPMAGQVTSSSGLPSHATWQSPGAGLSVPVLGEFGAFCALFRLPLGLAGWLAPLLLSRSPFFATALFLQTALYLEE